MTMIERIVHRAVATIVALTLFACNAEVKIDTDTPGDTTASDTIGDGADTVVTGGGLGGKTPATSPGTARDSAGTGTRHGGDTAAPPTSTTGNIRVSSPRPGDVVVGAGFTLRGESRTFENAASYRLRAADGTLLAEGHFTATGEMGTFSPFTATVAIARPYTGDAVLEVFEFSAKDGSEINMVRVPLKLRATGPSERRPVSVFFTNARRSPGATDCGSVFAAGRSIAATSAVARVALEELLRGPNDAEREQGFVSEIPAGTRLREVTITNGIARADFTRELNTAAGSCRVTAVRAQIERTLRQFPSVRQVIISVEGNSEEALQP